MRLKKLLHLCAMSAIQNDKEMKQSGSNYKEQFLKTLGI